MQKNIKLCFPQNKHPINLSREISFKFQKKEIKEKCLFINKKKKSLFFITKKIISQNMGPTFGYGQNLNIFWFRFNLRIDENVGFDVMRKFLVPPIVLICFDTRIINFFGKKRLAFLMKSTENLVKNLEKEKIPFIFQNGHPEKIISFISTFFQSKTIFFTFEADLYWKRTRKKEKKFILALLYSGIELKVIWKSTTFYFEYLLVQRKNLLSRFFFFLKTERKRKSTKKSHRSRTSNQQTIFSKKIKFNYLFYLKREKIIIQFYNQFLEGVEVFFEFAKILIIFAEIKFPFFSQNLIHVIKPLMDFGCICYVKALLEITEYKRDCCDFIFFNNIVKEYFILKKMKKIDMILYKKKKLKKIFFYQKSH